MNWRVQFRPKVEQELAEAAAWYERRQPGLGMEFIEEVIQVWDALAENPFLNSRRHPPKNMRWLALSRPLSLPRDLRSVGSRANGGRDGDSACCPR